MLGRELMRTCSDGIHLILPVIVAGLLFLIPSVEGAVLIVCPSDCDHSSIQEAIEKADPGDIIRVHSGTYRENVNVHKPHLTLHGVDTGGGKPVVDASGDGSAITLSGGRSLVEGLVLTNSGGRLSAGIYVRSDDNIVRENIVRENGEYGILIQSSSGNIITRNYINDNNRAISLQNSVSNVIFLNSFMNNEVNVAGSSPTNHWNSTDPITYRYRGKTFSSRLGNHWSDYGGPDDDDDAIGDAPHVFAPERDHHPLIVSHHGLEILSDAMKQSREVVSDRDLTYVVPTPQPRPEEVGGNTLVVMPGTPGARFPTIQGAIRAGEPGDTILVLSGTCDENVKVDKPLNLIGVDDGGGMPIINAYSWGSDWSSPISISADGCTVEGFEVWNSASGPSDAGIKITSNNNVIRGNVVTYSYSDYGIYIKSSEGNIITDNTIYENDLGGIHIESSRENVITGNKIYDNGLYGDGFGGIDLDSSTENIISGNIISDNSGVGIRFRSSSGNTIYLNDIIGNNPNAYSDSANCWNSPDPISYEYNGSPFVNFLGNRWSDYSGSDDDGDDIGDSPYNISGGSERDLYPLMGAWDRYVKYSGSAVKKTASSSSVRRGEEITYTITVCNNLHIVPIDIVVIDLFDRPVEFISASPAPGEDGLWRFDAVSFEDCRTITLVVKAPKIQDFEFGMEQEVAGRGFVNANNEYSTAPPPYLLTNCALVTFSLRGLVVDRISDCAMVTVIEAGTDLIVREHGSGAYESAEQLSLLTENDSISMDKDVSATYGSTTIGLYNNRTLTYSSKWTEEAKAKNRVTGAAMSESYRYATMIDRESRMKLDKNESVMDINSEFEGMGHVGFLKMPTNATPKTTPIFESREDYTGSFRVLEWLDEYGSSVSSEKSTSGEGFVAVDKRIKESQRSYESGTGTYDSEELIKTYTNYIAKDISLVHAPASLSLTDDVSVNSSLKWKEGIWSQVRNTSLIAEEYTGTTQLDKETEARGLNEMETEANFSGKARYRAVLVGEVDLDEQYEGDYSLQRKILFSGVPKYDRPHLTVVKEGSLSEETIIEDQKAKTIKVATYIITLDNDGNRALGPVYVKDIFPPGSKFINATLRPSQLTGTSVNWTLTHLAIGDESEILLNLDVTEHRYDELVNRVDVSGGIDGEWISASNFSALEVDWLTCCLNKTISVVKDGWVDEQNPKIIVYRVEVKNLANATRAITITDHLPEGMVLLNSSVPFGSYDNDVITWNLIDIGPFKTKSIEYQVEALRSGMFVNQARVDVRSVDGPTEQPTYADSVVILPEEECHLPYYGNWQLPNWTSKSYLNNFRELYL